MAISDYATRVLEVAMCSRPAAADVITVVDAGGGTIDASSTTRLKVACCSQLAGANLTTAINADSAEGDFETHRFKAGMANQVAAKEILDQVG